MKQILIQGSALKTHKPMARS